MTSTSRKQLALASKDQHLMSSSSIGRPAPVSDDQHQNQKQTNSIRWCFGWSNGKRTRVLINSLEEQSARDGALVASIVTMQEEVFASDYDLIPMDMRYAILAHKCAPHFACAKRHLCLHLTARSTCYDLFTLRLTCWPAIGAANRSEEELSPLFTCSLHGLRDVLVRTGGKVHSGVWRVVVPEQKFFLFLLERRMCPCHHGHSETSKFV